MPINWKEILVNAVIPTVEGVEETVVDSTLDDYFAKHPEAYKKIVPTAHLILNQLLPIFADSKIPHALVEGLIKGLEDSAKDTGIVL